MKHSSGTFSNYVGALGGQGFVTNERGGGVELTPKGCVWAQQMGGDRSAQTAEEIFQLWLPKLVGKQRDILTHLYSNPRTMFSRAELAKAVEMEAGSGTFSNYVGELSGLGLIKSGRGVVQINHEVFRL